MRPCKVFIGSSSQKGLCIAQALQEQLDRPGIIQARIWNEDIFKSGKTVFDTLITEIQNYDFAILVFTPDDEQGGGTRMFAPRDNVVFEFGLFMGYIGSSRTFIVANRTSSNSLKIPSDLRGLIFYDYYYQDSPDQTLTTTLSPICTKIQRRIQELGPNPQKEKELGVLYRLLNACTYPFYRDIDIEFIHSVNYREPEEFREVSQVIEFLEDLFRDYIYPMMNPSQLQALRIYFAYYLGDGIQLDGMETPITYCVDKDSEEKDFQGQFIIGMSNTEEFVEKSWRVGRAISGYDQRKATSNCAKVFQRGGLSYKPDLQNPTQQKTNYATEDELAIYTVPVEWNTHKGRARIGVLAISSRFPKYIPDQLRVRMQLLGNIVGFLFSLYAISSMADLEAEAFQQPQEKLHGVGIDSSDEQFIRHAITLRRKIATYFEQAFRVSGKHKWNGSELKVAESYNVNSTVNR